MIFANFAEAVAEGRGKAQADTLRRMRQETTARKLRSWPSVVAAPNIASRANEEKVPASQLKKGDLIIAEAGEIIPGDGEIIDGIASVDESAITGESAPVIREGGGDRSAVTGGTKVLSDRIIVRITADPGESFLDRMIRLVEGASRQKTPNEIALHILLVGLTLIFLFACATLVPMGIYSGVAIPATTVVALLVCFITTNNRGLLSAIGIAGMDRLLQKNVLAMSGRAVEAAGDVDVLLLDKTGTITLGNRMATALLPAPDVVARDLADAAQLASLADETPEGRSVVVLAKEQFGLRGRDMQEGEHVFVPFTAQTRMSGCDLRGRVLRKGAVEAVANHVASLGGAMPDAVRLDANKISDQGGTPLAVSDGARVLGLIQLKDVVKGGIRERFDRFRAMGIRTVMITGDNPRTAAAIAGEAGVDDFLAEATPEKKMQLIKTEQAKGKLVAMTGDGTNDAPALAQADVGVAMNTGTPGGERAGNMVDLDSDPTKLLEVVEVGKQLLMTRGALDHVLDRKRRRQVLRDPAGAVCHRVSRAESARRDAPRLAVLRDPERRHLQRADHRGADPARAARGDLPAARRARALASSLLIYGVRRHHRSLRGNQSDRPPRFGDRPRLRKGEADDWRTGSSRAEGDVGDLDTDRSGLSAPLHRARAGPPFREGKRQPRQGRRRTAGRLRADRAAVFPRCLFSTVGHRAAGDKGWDANNSGGSNYGATSKKLRDRASAEVARLKQENPDAPGEVPAELVTTSGSGLDPHLSLEAIRWQLPRWLARGRNQQSGSCG